MSENLFNSVLNSKIGENSFITWLLDNNSIACFGQQIPNFKCTQAEFISYFLNYIHEDVPCNERSFETPRKNSFREELITNNPSSRKQLSYDKPNNEVSHIHDTDLFSGTSHNSKHFNSSSDLNRPFSSNLELNKSSELHNTSQINFNSSTPKIMKIQSENSLISSTSFNGSYMSPVSPLYRNHNSFSTTPKNKRIPGLESTEKISPLCLGDFIITKKSSAKKKTQKQINLESNKSTSRRINPTALNERSFTSSFNKGGNSFNFKEYNGEASINKVIIGQRDALTEERNKIVSRKNSSENVILASRKLNNFNKKQVEVDFNLVTHQKQIDIVINIYVNLLNSDLVPNKISEIYFLISLLLNKQYVKCTENTNNSLISSDDSSMGVDYLEESSAHFLKNNLNNSDIQSSDLFESISNIIYFTSKVLRTQINVIVNFDKFTLKLLSENQRLLKFVPEFVQVLSVVLKRKSDQILEKNTIDVQTNVCFNSDTDNRENFPNDASFHAFRKQRDLFYEILRIWDCNHLLPDWKFSVGLSGKVKTLLNLYMEPANFMHFARLFKSQLLSTCLKSNKEESLSESQLPLNLALSNVDSEKLKRLKNRLITKCSTSGINSPPIFIGNQEFYKDFILAASNHVFTKHLADSITSEILQLNASTFDGTEMLDEDNNVDFATKKSYMICIKSLRVLAKFLGFIESLPYKSEINNFSENLVVAQLDVRKSLYPNFNVKHLLLESMEAKTIILTIPWLTEYLAMLDYVTLRLPYYHELINILIYIYRKYKYDIEDIEKNPFNYNVSLIKSCLGWFFELPHFPQNLYFKYNSHLVENSVKFSIFSYKNSTIDLNKQTIIPLDHLNIADEAVFYACCPYLNDIKKLLMVNMSSNNYITVKHITPVTALQSSAEVARKKIEMQLEEAFFNGQPSSLRRTVEFVSERVASSCVKHICNNIVPSYKKQALDNFKLIIDRWKQSTNVDIKKEQNLRTHSNMLAVETLKKLNEECEKEIKTLSNQRISSSIGALLAIDILDQTRDTCIAIAIKMFNERMKQWMESHVTTVIFMKDFESEFNKSQHTDVKKLNKDKPVFSLPANNSNKKHNPDTNSAAEMLDKIRYFSVEILEGSDIINESLVMNLLNETLKTLSERTDVNECINSSICTSLVDFSLLLVTHNCNIISNGEILQTLVKIWKLYYGKREDIFKAILCPRNIMMFAQSNDVTATWKSFARFSAFLIKQNMLSCEHFESQCIGIFQKVWDKDTLSHITMFFNKFLQFYRDSGGNTSSFTFLIDFLSDYCADLN